MQSSEYIAARKVLLDALSALSEHVESLVLVGAQAVYIYTGESGTTVPPYTTDADLALSPELLVDQPLLEAALSGAGFSLDSNPGRWKSSEGVYVDLMVPEALAGRRGRGADLGVHGRTAARSAAGLEAAIVDSRLMTIGSFEERDVRKFKLAVASPGALIVAKLVKIDERIGQPGRSSDKDALDVFRLLRNVNIDEIATSMDKLRSTELSSTATVKAVDALREHFTTPKSEGARMLQRATAGAENPDEMAASVAALVGDLLDAIESV